jgi:hypothetical protein
MSTAHDLADRFLQRSGVLIDQLAQRLRTGAGKGRLPVAPLAEQAVAWAEGVLAAPADSPLLLPKAPPGWDRVTAFHEAMPGHGSLPMPALARSMNGWLDKA